MQHSKRNVENRLEIILKEEYCALTFKLIGWGVYLEPCADSYIHDEVEDRGQHRGDVFIGALNWYCLATETDLCGR